VTSKRCTHYHPVAQYQKEDFRKKFGECAEKCLESLEYSLRNAPETGQPIRNIKGFMVFTLGDKLPVKIGNFSFRAVYIYTDIAVKWLRFSYEFIPAEQPPLKGTSRPESSGGY